MAKYVKKLENLESGPVSWENSEEIPLSDIGSLLNKRTMSPEWSASETALIRTDAPAITMTFTAPEDLTIDRFVVELTSLSYTTTDTGTAFDYSHYMVLSRMTVISGTGPDVGYDIFEGNSAASLGMFSVRNIGMSPKLNIRMAAGDVLEMDLMQGISFGGVPASLPITSFFTYEPEIDFSVSPKKILGGESVATTFNTVISAGTAASADITVLSAPATDTIDFNRIQSNNGLTFDASSNLVSGTGASGTNSYDNTAATLATLRDSIIAAINDVSNDFDTDWTASPGGAAVVTVTNNSVGASGNYDVIETTGDFSATAFTGGTSTPVGSFVFTPTVDIVLKNIYYSVFSDVNAFGPVVSPGYLSFHSVEITSVEIDGTPVPTGRGAYPPMGVPMGNKHLNVPVSAGETIEIFARAGIAGESHTINYAIVAELA